MKRFLFSLCIVCCINSNTLFSYEDDKAPIVILVSLDGFRWDYPDRGYSPVLQSISQAGVRGASLKPQFPSMTFPNHYSIITGLLPVHHGIIANYFANKFSNSHFSLKQPEVLNSQWYNGEAFWETARRNGIITASYFWPGSEIDIEYRRPDYYFTYEHNKPYEDRVSQALKWLSMPDSSKPRFITLYFDETDSKAHNYGTDSDELNNGIKRVDNMIAILDSGITALGLGNVVNLIVVSDHGMADISEDKIISLKSLFDYDENIDITELSTMAFINPPVDRKLEIYKIIKSKEYGFKAYLKEEIPERFNFRHHPFIGDIVVFADKGWIFNKDGKWNKKYVATHGYDNKDMNMQGIFFAKGPAFKSNYRTSAIDNLDIYPLLCKIFDIYPSKNIDGNLLNIIHILNE